MYFASTCVQPQIGRDLAPRDAEFSIAEQSAMEICTANQKVIQEILAFVLAGTQSADGALQERTYVRLHELIENHFDGSTNRRSWERLDWRIMRRFFEYVFAHGTMEWTQVGEELYGVMHYLGDPPPGVP